MKKRLHGLNYIITFIAMSSMFMISGMQKEEDLHAHFLQIVEKHSPYFKKSAISIRALVHLNENWKEFLNNPTTVGQLIEKSYELCSPYCMTKAEMAIELGTEGASAWCKSYLLTEEGAWQVKRLGNDFLRCATHNLDSLEKMTALLNAGIDVNITDQGPDECGRRARIGGYKPALITAVQCGELDLATFLIEKNANPNITRADDLCTPLIMNVQCLHHTEQHKMHESFYRRFKILFLLLQHPLLNLNQADASDKTASNYAAEYKMGWLQELLSLAALKKSIVS